MNPILTLANAALKVTNLWGAGKIAATDSLHGLPLGTSDGTATGELGVKVIVAASSSSVSTNNGSGLPYGADEMDITNVAAGPSVIVYKRATVTIKTRTLTYTNGGVSASDVLTSVVDS